MSGKSRATSLSQRAKIERHQRLMRSGGDRVGNEVSCVIAAKEESMILWIESQRTEVIFLIVFGLTYLAAVLVALVAALASRTSIGAELRTVTPGILSPLGAILGILIAFLAARVWANVDRAEEYVTQEISALRQAVLIVKSLPPDVRDRFRTGIKAHLEFIVSNEWPAMAEEHATLRSSAVPLEAALNALLSVSPSETNQQLAQSRAVIAIEDAFKYRRYRVWLSQAEIEPIQWIVIVLLSALIMVTIATIHIDNKWAMAASLFSFSTAIAICLLLLMDYDRPFGHGGFAIEPTEYLGAMPD
jgi:hypothetical protein